MAPLFSVIICTFNRADVLGQAIGYVLAQTFDDFELIVVDDGSTDETRRVVDAFTDSRVRYFYRENGGLSVARNSGATVASGTFVTFFDDDDEVKPEWLERFATAIELGGYTVVSCGVENVNAEGSVVRSGLPSDLGPAFDDLPGMFRPGSFVVRREAYVEVGGFAEKILASQHNEFALRLLPACRARSWRVGTVEEVLLIQHFQEPENRPMNSPAKLLNACEYIIDHHKEQLARDPDLLSNYYGIGGVAAARLRQYAKARSFFRAAAHTARIPSPRRRQWMRLALAYVPPLGNIVWRARAFDSV